MATIPAFMYAALDGSSVAPSPQDNLHKTQNAIGLPQYRPKQSSRLTRYNGLTYILDTSQLDGFRTFVDSTLRSGSLPFDMVDPIDGVTRSYKLIDGVYQARNIGRRTWRITLNLEFVQ